VDETLAEAGLKVRREVLGDEYVRRVADNATDFTRPFQQFVSEYCWGQCWADDTLPRRERSILNLGMLAALNRMEEFELHVRGALRNGVTVEELRAVLMQIAVYCGVPAGVDCFRRVQRILDQETNEKSAEASR